MTIIYDKHNCSSILFINYQGKLKALYTPFQVMTITTIGNLKANTIVYVEAVASTKEGTLIYLILGEAYHYYYFYLIAKF